MNKTKLIIIVALALIIAAIALIPIATKTSEIQEDVCTDDCCAQAVYYKSSCVLVDGGVCGQAGSGCSQGSASCTSSCEDCGDSCGDCGGDGVCDGKCITCPSCNGEFDDGCYCKDCDNTGVVELYGPFLCDGCDIASCWG